MDLFVQSKNEYHSPLLVLVKGVLVKGAFAAVVVFYIAVLAPSSDLRAQDGQAVERDPAAEAYFEQHVRPLLIDHCYVCHSVEADDDSGGLRVDDRVAIRKGGSRGAGVVPGDVRASLLMKAVTYDDPDLQMPPDQKLEPSQIEILRQWIETGAYDPREPLAESTPRVERADPSEHWAFQAPEAALPPDVSTPIDADILDAIVSQNLAENTELEVSPRASKETLLRRVSFDLTGLPPAEDIASDYLNDQRPGAYLRLVERLLAAPEFGQRWARHWMDVARYADTVGYTLAGRERRLFGSERYRDWLINSFNDDLPYDDMIRMQLAADVFDADGISGHLDAMGFLTVGRRYLRKHDILDDRIDVISRGLLGLTVTCARCHDHKFDPIPMTDYYSLFGILNSSEQDDKDSQWPLRLTDIEKPRDSPVFLRGQPGNRGPIAPRQFISVLEPETPERFTQGSGRKELAEKIASDANPLTARVYVNRVWAQLIGKPLVDSPSDFGVRTELPKHPQVLDDLAVQFVNEGWSTKQLIRRIVLTHIYQQSSHMSEAQQTADPDNRWLARANARRLDFEAMRDSVLFVSGRFEQSFGGEPVDVLAKPTPPRRTVYAFIDRQELPGVFRAFDFANPDAHAPKRYYTTVPQQALYLMNHDFLATAARDLVAEIQRELGQAASDDRMLTRSLFARVLGRLPRPSEHELAVQYLAKPAGQPETRLDTRRMWQYGVGTLSDEGSVTEFKPFPHFSDGRYAGSETFPDPVWQYSSLSAVGGHPGAGRDWAVVRRLQIDRDGIAKITGVIEHPNQQGDGIQVTITAGDKQRWTEVVKAAKRPFGPLQFPVKEGDTVDLVVSDNGSTSFDSFRWTASIQVLGEESGSAEFDTQGDFSGPLPPASPTIGLSRAEQLAQALMMSNEFCFVD